MWPLLAIVLVVGAVFATLVFHDRVRQAERTVTQVRDDLQSRVDQIERFQRENEDLRGQVDQLQSRLTELNASLEEQNQRLETLTQEVEAIPTTPIPVSSEEDELTETLRWTLQVGGFLLSLLAVMLS